MSLARIMNEPLRQFARRARSRWRHLLRSFQASTAEAQLVHQLRSAGIAEGDG
jgi:hypothetical protein